MKSQNANEWGDYTKGDGKSVFFYDKKDPYYEFTNFYECKTKFSVTIGNHTYSTDCAEKLFQAAKFLNPDGSIANEEAFKNVFNATSPGEAFKLANGTYKNDVRQDWHKVKKGIMQNIVDAKFSQDPDCRDLLIKTKGRVLVENSPYDKEWGNGPDGKGKNLLGQTLEDTRDRLERGLLKSFSYNLHYQEYYQVGDKNAPVGENGEVQLSGTNLFILAAKYANDSKNVKLFSQKGNPIGKHEDNASAKEIVLLDPNSCRINDLKKTVQRALKNEDNKERHIQFFVNAGGNHWIFGRLEPEKDGYNLIIMDPAREKGKSEYIKGIEKAVKKAVILKKTTDLSNNWQNAIDKREGDEYGIWTCGYCCAEFFKESIKVTGKLSELKDSPEIHVLGVDDHGAEPKQLVSSYQKILNKGATQGLALDLYKDIKHSNVGDDKQIENAKQLKTAILEEEKKEEEAKKKEQQKKVTARREEESPVEPDYQESEELKKLKRQRDAQQEKFDNAETRKQTLETEPSTSYGEYAIYGLIALIAFAINPIFGAVVLAGMALVKGGQTYYDQSQKKEANLALTREKNKLTKLDDSIENQRTLDKKNALENEQDKGDGKNKDFGEITKNLRIKNFQTKSNPNENFGKNAFKKPTTPTSKHK